MVGGAMIGMVALTDTSVTTRYFHSDNLGSIAVITDENGAVVERDSYDAWGQRRLPTGADGTPAASQTTRGFTSQEELADVGLVHLNGRVYDPLVGRMMSADPIVPDPLNGQAWNPYSYVINNPLAFTDPSGYCFLNLCNLGHNITTFFDRSFGVLFRDVPILGTLFEIAAVGLCTLVAGPNPVCAVAAFGSTTFVTGVTSGNLGYALRAGLIAGVTAVAFNVLGSITGPNPAFGTPQYLENVAGRALIGCASAAASGGKCGPGALAGGVTALAGPVTNGHGFGADLVMNSTVGGLASIAGGGKFANGAVTGAFGYLFSPNAGDKGDFGDDEYGMAVGCGGKGGFVPGCEKEMMLGAGGGTPYRGGSLELPSFGDILGGWFGGLFSSGTQAVARAASAIEEFLGPGARVIQGGPRSSSDLILRSQPSEDGTIRQLRFDLTDPGNQPPHINIEEFQPRNLYPGDRSQIYITNEHVYPKP